METRCTHAIREQWDFLQIKKGEKKKLKLEIQITAKKMKIGKLELSDTTTCNNHNHLTQDIPVRLRT